MNELLSHFSPFSAAIFFIVFFVVFSLACLYLIKRFCKSLLLNEVTDYGQIFAGAIGVTYALILAFVAVATWQNYDKVDDGVRKEANCLHNVYRNLSSYPEHFRLQMHTHINRYVHMVIDDEWPKQSQGIQDETAHKLITDINTAILSYYPQDNREMALHQETLKIVSEYRSLRHDRIIGGRPNLTIPMWITLIGGTILHLIFLCFFDIPCFRHHAFMIGMYGAFVALVYCLLIVYNFPFASPSEITPEPFQKLLEYWKID
jgi:ABC-type multidrug transport system fused ATPase/permease subunit